MSTVGQDKRLGVKRTRCFSVLCRVDGVEEPMVMANDGGRESIRPGSSSTTAEKVQGSTKRALDTSDSGVGTTSVACVEVICPYTRALVAEGFARRRDKWRITVER